MTSAYVTTNIDRGIASIKFFHPAQNSLPSTILCELADKVKLASDSDEVKVIILRSGGDRTFCAGASFTELMSIDDVHSGLAFFSGFANVINQMRKSSKLIIGRIQGKTVGGGVGLAAATDYCMASKYAAAKLSELAIGIGPFVVGPAVERKIGLSAMSQMTIDAESFYDANWALSKGLYTQIFDTAEELDVGVDALAHRLSAYSPEAMSELKKVFWQGTDHWDDLLPARAAISGRLILSEFTRNKLARFATSN